eukprot:165739-Rhodomonas_salina.2
MQHAIPLRLRRPKQCQYHLRLCITNRTTVRMNRGRPEVDRGGRVLLLPIDCDAAAAINVRTVNHKRGHNQ